MFHSKGATTTGPKPFSRMTESEKDGPSPWRNVFWLKVVAPAVKLCLLFISSIVEARSTNYRKSQSTVDLLIKVACFVKKGE